MASTGLIVHRHYHAAVLNAFGSLDRRTLQTIAIQLPRNSSYYHKTPGNRNSSPHLPLVFCLPQNLTSSWFIPYHLIILSHKENATNDNGMPILRIKGKHCSTYTRSIIVGSQANIEFVIDE